MDFTKMHLKSITQKASLKPFLGGILNAYLKNPFIIDYCEIALKCISHKMHLKRISQRKKNVIDVSYLPWNAVKIRKKGKKGFKHFQMLKMHVECI